MDLRCRDFFDDREIRKVVTFVFFRRLIAEHTVDLALIRKLDALMID